MFELIIDHLLWFNFAVLLLGASGSFLLAIFGLPNLKIVSSESYTEINETTPEIRRVKILSKVRIIAAGDRLRRTSFRPVY